MSAKAVTAAATDAARSEKRLAIFRQAAGLLSSSLDFTQTLASVIEVCLPALGDFGFFDVMTDGGVVRTARAYDDARIDALLASTQWTRLEGRELNLCALSTGEAALHADIDDEWYRNASAGTEHLELMRALAFKSMITLPMRFRGELVGSLTLFMGNSGRRHSEDDLAFARDLAALAAPAVVNARLMEKQRSAETALRASEERLRLATDAGQIGIWDWDISLDRVIWSDQVYHLHGLRPGEFGGRAENFTELVHPEDRVPLWEHIESAIRYNTAFSTDFRIIRPDGVVRWLSMAAHLYRDTQGGATRMVGAITDITARKRAEESEREAAARAESEATANAKFRTFFDQGSYFAGVMALDGTVLEANRVSLEACGFTREEVIGKKFWECGWWNRSPELMQTIQEASALVAAGGTFRREMEYFVADGSIRMGDIILSPIKDDRGEVIFIAPTGTDITERRKAQERLALLDSISEATRIASDPREVMMATTRLLGEHMKVTRCAYADVEPDNNRFTIRDDWRVEGAFSTAGEYSLDLFGPRASAEMRAGRTLVIRNVDTELPAGEGADMFNTIGIKAIICYPLVKDGKLAAMMAVHQNAPRDWTTDDTELLKQVVERSWAHIERVRATEMLREREAHLASLFEQTAAGVCETDLTGRILRANERYCQILRRLPHEVIGRQMQSFTHVEDLPRNAKLFEKAVTTGESFQIEKRYLCPDGTDVWVSNTVSLIERANGEAGGSILAIVIDINERKRAEHELIDADRRKDEFLAMLAHELRNPLAPISAAAELLTMTALDPERIRMTSEVIGRQVRHMTGLVDDLLDVSRVTRGLVTLDMRQLDLKEIVSDAAEQVRPLMEQKRHHLGIELPDADAHVNGDAKRMVQVLTNILNNAAKYTPQGGDIRLRLETRKREILLSVLDNGIGIEPDLQPHVFELFAQAKRSSDRSQGGLGIGLALVKSLVELHGGSVSCHSDGLNNGSRFLVTLPRIAPQSADDDAADEENDPARSEGKLRILVVDDNVDAAQMLAMYLETAGHEVFVEYGSRRALERARIEKPDVCILDIGLPDMDGNQLARRLRNQKETAQALLIAVTGYGQEQDKAAAAAAGFDNHLVKPVDVAELGSLLPRREG